MRRSITISGERQLVSSPFHSAGRRVAALIVAGTALAAPAGAQTLAAPFTGAYAIASLGSVSGVPTRYGGLTFLDANTILLGGHANEASCAIYAAAVVRDAQHHVTGFGPATLFATAPSIDGGVAYGPGGVLFAVGYPNNTLYEYRPGSGTPDRTIALAGLGVASSTGSLAFVPSGFPGAGTLKILSYSSGRIYDAPLTADGSGTYAVGSATLVASGFNGPEGLAYIPTGSALFATPSALVAEYATGVISAFAIDADGTPIVGTRQAFVTGLTGAEGAVIDPVSGDFLFSTFNGGNRIVRVSGFAAQPTTAPEPGTVALCATGLVALAGMARRRRGV